MFKVNNKDIRTTPMASCFTNAEPVTGIGLPFESYFQVFFGWSIFYMIKKLIKIVFSINLLISQ